VTDFFEPFGASGPEEAIKVESTQGINLANAAIRTSTLEHYIWSTLPNGSKISHRSIPHFEAKNRVDDYIKQNQALYEKTTFLWITWYPSNYQYPIFTPNLLVSLQNLSSLIFVSYLDLT
jgi:NmrA-like family